MAAGDNKSTEDEDIVDNSDWDLRIAFNNKRHSETIEGVDGITQTWRMKERMKTVSVALVICLNVGVDPPDIVKTQPCARLECWIDPLAMCASRSLEAVGNALQKQYERWQPRARYKQSLDPTVEEVKKLCTSLRRNAKEERVLFHYNGHGVPRPTANGEIWVFNRTYTQYIPLSVYDLQTWMGAPSIYVYDCSNAGIIVDLFKQFAEQHEKDETLMQQRSCPTGMSTPPPSYKNCIQLAACAADEILPMHPDLPADIFTSCLTTPIRIALRWFVMQNSSRLVPKITLDLIEKIPGQLSDRRTMLGELNWIFTAITDTIAWNTLPRELFQKLFRQDLLVASLFRNFLLAERIMHSYNCTPVSSPQLPPTHLHPMWSAWDLALDQSLANLPAVLESEDNFRHSGFFQDQLTAFQVSLSQPISHGPPTQLPIVLQVLLSQVHRLRALELLGRFLDLGPKAVNLALSVGIFPYVLKLLQSSAKELRPLLVFIWAKILAVDSTCQADLVRDNGHKYFLSILQDSTMSSYERMLATFVLACIVDKHESGQEAALQGSLISICLEQLQDPEPKLRQWLAVCLGRLWRCYDQARWTGVRDQAHDKLYLLLGDPLPEVRAAAVFALGTFINSGTVRSEHANCIDQGVAMTLLNIVGKDMSPLVRKELVVALQNMVIVFENSFLSAAFLEMKEGNQVALASGVLHSPVSTLRRNASKDRLKSPSNNLEVVVDGKDCLKRVSSSSSISSLGSSPALPNIQFGSVYHKMWLGLTALDDDPYPSVATMARKITDHIRQQLCAWPGQTSPHKEEGWSVSVHMGHLSAKESMMSREHEGKSSSLPPSPSNRPGFFLVGNSPPKSLHGESSEKLSARISQKSNKRKTIRTINEDSPEENNNSQRMLVSTQFVEWSCKYFAEPVMKENMDLDVESPTYTEREWRYKRNARMRREATEEISRVSNQRLEHGIFTTRVSQPMYLLLHPYENHIAIACKDSFIMRDYTSSSKVVNVKCCNRSCRVTSLEYINAHDNTLIATACDDASVRVYNQTGTLVTAWQALHYQPKINNHGTGAGTVMRWDEKRLELLVAGERESRCIRCWDAEKEMSSAEIPTGCNDPVSCISIDPSGGYLMAAGCGDGSVRLFDRRAPPSDSKLLTYRDLSGKIVNVSLQHSSSTIICGSTGGDVRVCDTRKNHSVLACHTSQGMKAMAVHPSTGIFACGSSNQISIYHSSGTLINVIRAHDQWFSNTKFGPASCLAFHPHRILLAAGSSDNSVCIYSTDPKR